MSDTWDVLNYDASRAALRRLVLAVEEAGGIMPDEATPDVLALADEPATDDLLRAYLDACRAIGRAPMGVDAPSHGEGASTAISEPCRYFAYCEHETTRVVDHPILGAVACCERCATVAGVKTRPRTTDEPSPERECRMCGWTLGTNAASCGECASHAEPAPTASAMYAIVTESGTAAAETALCDRHYADPALREEAARQFDTSAGVASGWRECSGNDVLACGECGAVVSPSHGVPASTAISFYEAENADDPSLPERASCRGGSGPYLLPIEDADYGGVIAWANTPEQASRIVEALCLYSEVNDEADPERDDHLSPAEAAWHEPADFPPGASA